MLFDKKHAIFLHNSFGCCIHFSNMCTGEDGFGYHSMIKEVTQYTVFKIAIFARHRVGQNSSMIALKTANSGPIRGAKNSFSLHFWVC